MRNEPRTVLPRVLGGFAGLLLAAFAGFGWYLADLLLGAVETSDATLTEAGDSTERVLSAAGDGAHIDAALVGASNLERFGHSWLGNVSSATEHFQTLTLLSMSAGSIALTVALRRRPLHRWPEFAWIAAALLALAPAVVLQPWLFVSVPLAGLIALAAVLHLTRRHDLTVARGAAAARRGTSQLAPAAEAATQRTNAAGANLVRAGREQLPAAREQVGAAATRVLQTGREQLPGARAHADAVGKRGKALANRSAPVARNTIRKLRGGGR